MTVVDMLGFRPCSGGLNGDMPLGSAEAHVANKVMLLANRKGNICDCLLGEGPAHSRQADHAGSSPVSPGGLGWRVQACCIILIWLFIPATEASVANTT